MRLYHLISAFLLLISIAPGQNMGPGGIPSSTGSGPLTVPSGMLPPPPDPPVVISPIPVTSANPNDTGRGHGQGGGRGPIKGSQQVGGTIQPVPGQRPPPRGPRPRGRPGAPGGAAGARPGGGKGHGADGRGRGGRGGTTMTSKQAAAHLPWQVWWTLNNERFVDQRRVEARKTATSRSRDTDLGSIEDSGDVVAASRADILSQAIPVLLQSLKDRSATVRGSAAIAIGRLATPKMTEVLEGLKPLLKDDSVSVPEATCLGLGLSGHPSAVPILVEIMADSPAGRELVGRSRVTVRMRSYAAIALGLVAARDSNAVSGPAITQLVQTAIKQEPVADLQLASLTALQFLGDGTVRSALRLVLNDVGQRGRTRAQAALVLGKIGAEEAITDLRKALSGDNARVARTAATALGLLSNPADKDTVSALMTAARSHADRCVRNLALMGLGEIGGDVARDALLKGIESGVLLDRTWSTMALGVMGFKNTSDMNGVADYLLRRYKTVRSVSEKSALALAIGLIGEKDPAPALALALRTRRSPELRGNLAIAVGLLGHRDARNELRRLLVRPRDDGLTRQASSALGLLQDGSAVEILANLIASKRTSGSVSVAAARALGQLGDARGVPALIKLVSDKRAREISRACAAAALGIIGDKDTPRQLFTRMRQHTNSMALSGLLYEFALLL